MSETKTKVRVFTIADYIEEEEWLREEHKNGWKIKKLTPPLFYTFERCEPEDVVYKLDYKNARASEDYKAMFADYGWEYFGECFGWNYFRKTAAEIDNENDGEILSDNDSRVDMIKHVLKTRMLPIFIIFLCVILPNFFDILDSGKIGVSTVLWICLFAIYTYIIIHCGLKLRKLKNDLE